MRPFQGPNNSLTVAVIVALLYFGSASSFAAPAVTSESVVGLIHLASAGAINKLTAKAISWLAIFTLIQFMITNYGLLKADGGIDAVIGKAVGSFVWMGVCIYIMNNAPKFIGGVGDEFFNMLGFDLPTPGGILADTFKLSAVLTVLAGSVGILSDPLGSLIVYLMLFLLAVGVFFAFKIFMIQLELGLIVLMSPLSFSFLGMNALRDQGIAPFKALISLGYRIIFATLILSTFAGVWGAVWDAVNSLSTSDFIPGNGGIGTALNTVLSGAGAYLFLVYLFFKSDSVAASLAGGHTSMGTGDVASAAAAGAAAGALIASAGAAAAGTASKGPQSMLDVMGKIMGKSSVSNASSMGVGGQSTELSAPPPLAASGPSPETSGTPPPMPEGGPSPASSNIGPNFDNPAPSGSGANAGIGGKSPNAGNAQGQRSKPTFTDRLGKANQHISQERGATSISINTNNSH